MRDLISSLNNSKLLMGLAMLLLNVGSKYIEIGLSRTQEEALRNALGRELLIFAVVFTATRDIITSVWHLRRCVVCVLWRISMKMVR